MLKLTIYDTAGQERYACLSMNYFKQAHAVTIVYDCTSQSSFNQIEKWCQDIDEKAQQGVLQILVCNKIDLLHQRVITSEQGQQMAQKHNLKYFEISAMSGVGIKEMFKYIYTTLYELMQEQI